MPMPIAERREQALQLLVPIIINRHFQVGGSAWTIHSSCVVAEQSDSDSDIVALPALSLVG